MYNPVGDYDLRNQLLTNLDNRTGAQPMALWHIRTTGQSKLWLTHKFFSKFDNSYPAYLAHCMRTVQYVTDTNGKPLYVQVPIAQYEKLLADAEALADIATYKKAKRNPGKSVPLDEAFAAVEAYQKGQNS